VLGGSSGGSLSTVASGPRTGFETALPITGGGTTFEVQALNASGKVIGTSRQFTASG
jgi:hypothetical protein